MARPTKNALEGGFILVFLAALVGYMVYDEGVLYTAVFFVLLVLGILAFDGLIKVIRKLGR